MDGLTHPAVGWQARLDEADRLVAIGNHADAEALYRDVRDDAPQAIAAYLGGARCARARGDRHAALAWLDAALAVDSGLVAVQLERAADLRALHRDDEEAAAYQAVLALAPQNVAALLGLGKHARRRGDRPGCMLHFQAAAQAAPANPWPRLDIGDECRELGQYAEAEAAYRQALALAPDMVQAHRGLGHCARQRGDRAAALAHFRTAMELAPADPGPALEVADDLRELGQMRAAEAAYRQVLDRAPDDKPALQGLAACARQRGDRAAALAHATTLAALAPGDIGLQLALAEDLREAGRLIEAEATYRRLLAADADNVAARLGLGKCARLRGHQEVALEHFRAAAAAAPDNVWPWIDTADQCRDLGRLDEADAAYHRALLLDRGRPQAWLGLAHCARQRGARWQSLALFQAAWLAAPASLPAQLEVALDLRELGLLQQAEQIYRQALAEAPGNPQAQLGLGLCARRRGDRRAALALFRAAAAADPGHPAAALELAADLRELGDLDGAEALCRALAARRPDDPDAWVALGFCARARGDRATAMAHFQQATVAQPGHVGAWLELAFEQRESGDPLAAIATAQGVLQRHPASLPALLSIGLSERQAGDHAAALDWFERAHAAYPAQAGPLVEMALQARILGDQARADALLAQARQLEPGHVGAIQRQAEHALMAFDAEAAHALYAAASAEQPGQTALRLGLADALAARGRIEDALAELDTLEATHGPLAAILHKRLQLLRRDGDYPAALRQARAASARLPRHFGLWAERLQAELLVGTEADIQDWLAAAPAGSAAEQASLHRCHGFAAERLWQLERAVSHYREAAAALPEDAGIQHDLLRTQVLTLDVAGAQATLRRFCRLLAPMTRLQNKSLNVSQTHFGQILDEYRLDEAVPAAADILRLRAPKERARRLRGLVRRYPDSTAVAVSLLVALRQAGILARRAPAPEQPPIPCVIAQFWDSGDPPPDVARLMRTWPDHNPDYRIARFDDDSAREFLAARLPPEVLRAYAQVHEPAQQADIFRLAWLATEGGVYTDADDRCLAPLGTILPAGADLVLFQEDLGTLANDFIAARPGHPALLTALDLAVAAINRGDSDIVWLSTGPGLLTRAVAQWLPDWDAAEPAMPDGTIVLDRHELFQAVAPGCMTGYKTTRRHWSNSSFAGRPRAPVAGAPAAAAESHVGEAFGLASKPAA